MSAASRWRDRQIQHDDAFHQWCDDEGRDPEDGTARDDFESWCEDEYASAAETESGYAA